MNKILSILLILLLVPSISYANKWHTKMKKKEKKDFAHYVLKAQSDNKMVFNPRNVPNRPGLIKFFDKIEDKMGVAEKGIEINLSYSDVGDKLDWSRLGEPGFAQRFNIMEPYKHTTKKGKTKWYRVGYFIPEDTRTDKHTLTIFDFKKLYLILSFSFWISYTPAGQYLVSGLSYNSKLVFIGTSSSFNCK